MSAYTPDLTGQNTDYYVTTYQRTIFQYPQKIVFGTPVFRNNTLEVTTIGTLPRTLTYGVDYIANADDLDLDAMSVCKNIDPTFNKTLLKSLTILAYVNAPIKIQLVFNQLYADDVSYATINTNTDLEVTPALVANMLAQIVYLQQVTLGSSNAQYSPQSGVVKLCLLEDPSGTDPANTIMDEPHDVDTVNNERIIRPIYGSFFKDSVSVKIALTGVELHVDTDYVITDLDLTRTEYTSNTSGVYRTIKILKPVVGEVLAGYQAYGGEADAASVRNLQSQLTAIQENLTQAASLTPQTLPASPTIISINNKLQELEGNMRLLLQNGLPTYGDVTHNTAVLKKIVSQNTNLHWWSIATLYRVNGSVNNVLADVFKFRLTSLISQLMFECSVAVNVNDGSTERLSVTCNNSNIPFDTLYKYCPKLRIIQVNSGGAYSGVVLQLGMTLSSGILQETLDIEDMSGTESCWIMTPFSAESIPAQDTGVLMPNGTLVYSAGSENSIADTATIPFPSGINILLSDTNIPLTIGNTVTPGNTTNTDMVVQIIRNLSLRKVKAFNVSVTADIGTPSVRTFEFVVPVTLRSAGFGQLYGRSTIVTPDGTYTVSINLSHSPDNVYEIGYYITSTNQAVTLNVTATKLTF